MKRTIVHSFFHRLAVVAVALSATLSGLHAASDDRPNILWVIVEDASCHIGPYGETAIKTPNLDALAAQGVTYTAAYVTAPVCSASRSAMITGMNQSTLGVHNHRSQMDSGKGMGSPAYHDSYHLPIRMIPELFQQAGYHTAQNSGVKHSGKRGKTDYNFIWDQFEYDSPHWLDGPKDKPFFAVLQLKGGKSRKNDTGKVDPGSVTLPPYYPDHPVFQKDWADYLGSWLQVDREVGTALRQLQDAGRLENTAVFFMTDHGVSHLRGKQYVYEEGIRVPLVVRLPKGRFAGSTRNDLVNQIDVSATSLALAGIAIPNHIQGRDFLAKDYAPRKAVFSARDRCDETVEILRSVRTGRFKYIRNFMSHIPHVQPNQYKDGKEIMKTMKLLHAAGELNQLQGRIFNSVRPTEELYDLRRDPHETVNLAREDQHKKTLLTMRTQLYDHMVSSRDLGLIPEPILEDLGRRYASKFHILKQPENRTLVRDLINIIEAGENQDVARLLTGLNDE
ncbi:MAG: sulfatase, partial [Planctomycetaceae bacterium]|nr:sulfatase [Planctomycetaceae bacterium]